MKYYALIVGGGTGNRMQSNIPKQFMLLKGRPVLMHTIEAFHSSGFAPEIIVVLNVEFQPYWEKLCEEHNFTIPHQVVSGGEHRFHSVKNGLRHVNGCAIIAIHDAVRPCISHQVIDAAFIHAENLGNAVVAVKSKDSIRQNTKTGTVGLKREDIFLVQTPQVFRSEILNKAYEQEYRSEFTDDASVVEQSGVKIELIEGDTRNIKITYADDFLVATVFME